MPCRDYDWDPPASSSSMEVKKLRKQNDRLARIACKAMDELVKQGKADFLLLKDKEVREWYEKHVEADRKAKEAALEKRRKAEAMRAEKERRKRVRESALAKLTQEERDLLLGNLGPVGAKVK